MSLLLFQSFTPAVAANPLPSSLRVFADEAEARFTEVGVMSQQICRRQHDTLPAVRAQAFTASGFVDLTQFSSIVFRMVDGSTVVQGAATGDASGNLVYEFSAGDLAVAGTYQACFVATDPSGNVETFPTGHNLTVVITPAL